MCFQYGDYSFFSMGRWEVKNVGGNVKLHSNSNSVFIGSVDKALEMVMDASMIRPVIL